jgi:hypothetical protein
LSAIKARFGSWSRACQLAGVAEDPERLRRELEVAIVEAYREGVPKPEIQHRFGVSRDFVRQTGRRAGLPPRPRWPAD